MNDDLFVPADWSWRDGVASESIDPISIQPGEKILITCRVSWWEQHRNGNLDRQAERMTLAVEAKGGRIVDAIKRTCSGKEPYWLREVAEVALKHDARILALSTDRLIRHPDFHSIENPKVLPRQCDFVYMRACLLGLRPMTLIHPDATDSEVRRIRALGNKGGRPVTRRRPPVYQRVSNAQSAEIRALSEQGESIRKIAEQIGFPPSTVQYHLGKIVRSKNPMS